MADDITLNPGSEPVPAATRPKNHRGENTFFPEDGNRIGVLYVEVAPSDVASALVLVNQLKVLAVDSWMIHGTANANPDRRTSVHVQITQLPNAQMPSE